MNIFYSLYKNLYQKIISKKSKRIKKNWQNISNSVINKHKGEIQKMGNITLLTLADVYIYFYVKKWRKYKWERK